MPEKARGARQGHSASPATEASVRQDLQAGNSLPEADFDRLLAGWLDSPGGGRITIKLVCGNGIVLSVTDQAAVVAMLRAEVARRAAG